MITHIRLIFIILTLSISLSMIFDTSFKAAYSQESEMKTSTDGGSLDVVVQPDPVPVDNTAETKFKVSFLKPGTDTIQVHVDYDFIIEKGGEVLYKASNQLNQPILHTAEGIVNIPFTFDTQGDYSIKVSVEGINFVPIRSEVADFSLQVVPEFLPIAALTAAFFVVLSFVVLGKRTDFKII